MTLTSFTPDSRALIIGTQGGIGQALVHLLAEDPAFSTVYATSRQAPAFDAPNVTSLALDFNEESSVKQAIDTANESGSLALIIVASGLLHDGPDMQPEKSWRAINPATMERAFAVNCIGPALVMKHALPRLARGERSVVASLSARVGSISDNRLGGWYAYRSAKAALNMIIKTASIELARVNPTASVIGLHPGTVDSALSKPFQGNVPEGKLFSAERAARQLLTVVDGVTPDNSGTVLDWRGHVVPA